MMATPPEQRAMPFPAAPPGLEVAPGAGSQSAGSALDRVADTLRQLGAAAGTEQAVQVVREAMMADVEAKVSKKVEELWRRGQQAITKMEEKSRDKSQRLDAEVARMAQRQQILEAENEKLREVIATLMQRFAMMSNARSPCAAPADATSPAPPTVSSKADSELFAPFTPVQATTMEDATTTASVSADDHVKPLPEVPAFPVPGQGISFGSPVAAAPLSLAEALGSQTPQQERKPLSLVSSLAASPVAPSAATAGCSEAGQAVRIFSFTIRKADNADLGLNVSHDEKDKVLRVEGVRPEGAVEAWNRVCLQGASREKAVIPGDRIVEVNGVSHDPLKMLEECRDKALLRLTIHRGCSESCSGAQVQSSPMRAASCGATAGVSSSATVSAAAVSGAGASVKEAASPAPKTMRAEANVFVPMAASASAAPCTPTQSPKVQARGPHAEVVAAAAAASPLPAAASSGNKQ
eukprot:TRINITY_DN40290_c0_g1_i1.p1 TRINITY_DN40290_c0_g1~~TRINITY_DN40290_c0_g1_i1.p1  ORF type:complete len:482 (+),score=99.07 TRINITY_DN40290_c0_g1_i1:49-1446(+)